MAKVHAVRTGWGGLSETAWCGLDRRSHTFEFIKHGIAAKLNGKVTCGHCINTAKSLGRLSPKKLRELEQA